MILRAFFFMIFTALGFSWMSVLVKRLSPEIPIIETMFFRSIVNFVILLPVLLIKKEDLFPGGEKRKGLPLLYLRGVLGFGGLICFFYAISHLPLSIASMLGYCAPLFVFFISRIFLKEPATWKSYFWVLVAIGGLSLLIGVDFKTGVVDLPLVPVLVGLLGAFVTGFTYTTIRAATAHFSTNLIVLYFTGVCTILAIPMTIRQWVTPTAPQLLELFFVGVFATVAQTCMTRAYRAAPAGIVSTMGLMTSALGVLWGWWIFNEVIRQEQWLGMVFLGLGITMVVRQGRR